jgi:hypothetical protein
VEHLDNLITMSPIIGGTLGVIAALIRLGTALITRRTTSAAEHRKPVRTASDEARRGGGAPGDLPY